MPNQTDSRHSYSVDDRIKMAGRLRQLAKEMTEGDPKTAAMLVQAARMIERQPGEPRQAHSKTEYKRLKEQGANVVPPSGPNGSAKETAKGALLHGMLQLRICSAGSGSQPIEELK